MSEITAQMEALIRQRVETSTALKHEVAKQSSLVAAVAGKLIETYKAGKKVLLFGNGGSAADAQHLAAELVGRYYLRRRALPAIALTVNTSVITAVGNDYGFDIVFARQVEAFGDVGDTAIGISTSGESRNVIEGLKAARRKEMTTIGMTGTGGGGVRRESDLCICVPSNDTPRVQEAHILIGHLLCELVEAALCGSADVRT